MYLNLKKKKIIKMSQDKNKIRLKNEIENVTNFDYAGFVINSSIDHTEYVRRRLAMVIQGAVHN